MTTASGQGAGDQATVPPFLRSLRRSTSDRKIAGVLGGIARPVGIDPLVLRIAVVILALFAGAGVLIYSLAWLLLPEDGQDESGAERLVRGKGDSSVIAPIVGVIVGLPLLGNWIGNRPSGLAVLGLFLALGLIVALRGERTTVAPARPRQADSFGRTAGTAYATAQGADVPAPPYAPSYPPGAAYPPPPMPPGGPAGPPWPPAPAGRAPRPPKPPRPSAGPLAALTLSGAVVLAGVASIAAVVFGADIGAPFVLGSALIGVGLGIAAAAYWGRAGGLPLVGTLLTVVLLITGVVQDEFPSGGWGDETYRPTTIADAQQHIDRSAGGVVLDLRQVPLNGQRVAVKARLGIGSMRVLVPADVALDVQADVHWVGEIRLPGRDVHDGGDVSQHLVDPTGAAKGTLVLDLDLTIGDLEVQR